MSTTQPLYAIRDMMAVKTLVGYSNGNHKGWQKLIQTGELPQCDYGVGFFNLMVYYWTPAPGEHFVRIWFDTIDDGDYGSWKNMDSKEEADTLVEKLKEVFVGMIKFPSEAELNKLLIPYGVYVCAE